MKTKLCVGCWTELPVSEFYIRYDKSKPVLYGNCKKCHSDYGKLDRKNNPEKYKTRARKYYQENKNRISAVHKAYYYKDIEKTRIRKSISIEKHREKKRELGRRKNKELREKFLSMYGNKCACCGESHKEFLTMEHRNGQVGKAKKEYGKDGYTIATKDYRPDLYEVLCWNCNCAKGRYGYCPHKK